MARRSRTRTGQGRFERILFSFMGPPELGDLNAPPTRRPPAEPELCAKCEQPLDRHEVVRTSSRTYLTCP